jgi:hypothetical protein
MPAPTSGRPQAAEPHSARPHECDKRHTQGGTGLRSRIPPGVFIGSDGDECALLDDCGKRTGSIIAQAQELMKAKGIAPQRLKMAALCSVCAELAILEHSGSTVEDRGNHLIVRTPDNPDFH